MSSLLSEQKLAIADALGDEPAAFATIRVTPQLFKEEGLQPSYTGSLSGSGQASEVSALRIIVFFESEGKAVVIGMECVYVYAGTGREKAKGKEAESNGVEEAGELLLLDEGEVPGSSK
jgi:hypothetical protein